MTALLPRKTFPLLLLVVMSAALPSSSSGAEAPAPSIRTHVKLKGDLKVASSEEAERIVKKAYDARGPRIGATNFWSYFGLVSLPFEVKDFAQANDSVFLFKLAPLGSNITAAGDTFPSYTSIAQAWVNPKNGKCLFFDAPWLMKDPKDVDGEFVVHLPLRKLDPEKK